MYRISGRFSRIKNRLSLLVNPTGITKRPFALSKGFTIVELLIVIVVIGILAAIVVVAFNGIQGQAKDAERKSELAGLQKALEMFRVENGGYPTCGATPGPNVGTVNASGDTVYALSSGTAENCLTDDLVPKYISSIPKDPVNTGSYRYHYAAGYKKVTGNSYNNMQTDNYILGVRLDQSATGNYSGWSINDMNYLLGSTN